MDSREPMDVVPVGTPGVFFYDPDPTILRARLVRPLAARISAGQIDPEIAYLTSDVHVPTPFARSWRVLRHGPFGLKPLNRWLAELPASDIVVKKRGSAVDVDDFRSRLQVAREGRPVTVFLTRCQGRPWMVVGETVE